MSALMEEFIPSPFFHTEQGFHHFEQDVSAWLHQIPSTSPACHSTGSPSSPFTIPSPGPLYSPSSFLLPQPAHYNTLGFGTMWNLPQPRAQLGHCGWSCCTRVHNWGVCIMQKNVSMHSCLTLSFQEIFSNLVLLFKRFPSTVSKGIHHFKKQQGLIVIIPPIPFSE